MFNNKNTGWKRTEELNKGGPKTKSEVEQEVQDKLNKENQERRRDDDRRGGNRGYNDRGYDNRDNRDNRNNRDGNRNNNRDRDGGKGNYNNKGGEQKYQKKNTEGGDRMDKQNSRGGRNDRGAGAKRDDRPPRDIVEITDEDMGKQLRKNFELFVSTEKYNKHLNEENNEEEEPEEEKKDKKPRRHDFGVYRRLAENNGKKESMMLHFFLTQVFELDKPVIEDNLPKYLDQLSQNKSLGKANFSEGISTFISMMPELALDSPLLHQLLWKNVMKPLVS
jgi:hypothetical protein